MSTHVTIIAEAGVNHDGDIGKARELVAAAADAGADIVKFQTFIATESISSLAPKANYQKINTGNAESQLEMVKKLELSLDDHLLLVDDCKRHNIEFLSTAFDFASFDLLMGLGIKRVKIPSGEITNKPLIEKICSAKLPVILSTGMANLGEVEAALTVIQACGIGPDMITLLHCNTEYPTPFSDVNLTAMLTLGAAFGTKIGYSDHTLGTEVPIAAVALGATIIEKHFTLSRSNHGPDHAASLEPLELAGMTAAIRNIEVALGSGRKVPSDSEASNRLVARKSIVARRFIKTGEELTAENLAIKRPGTGISPMAWNDVIGRVAIANFEPDELIRL